MAGLILFLVIIAALSAVFALYGLTVGAAGYVLFFGLLLAGAVVFSVIAGVMALSMPAAKPHDNQQNKFAG